MKCLMFFKRRLKNLIVINDCAKKIALSESRVITRKIPYEDYKISSILLIVNYYCNNLTKKYFVIY